MKLIHIPVNGPVTEQELKKFPKLEVLYKMLDCKVVERTHGRWINGKSCEIWVDANGFANQKEVNLTASAIFHNSYRKPGEHQYDDLEKNPAFFCHSRSLQLLVGDAAIWVRS